MAEQKKTYYIDVGTGHITKSATDSTWSFKIQATDEEITDLRELFDQNYSTEWQNFIRSHVPFLEYHYDKENDAYDRTIQQVYGMLYKLGDEEAKRHIESMNILPGES
ncbi:hydrolase [Bacillus sp. BRMEA1]|uniref:hydrolase n=1 Tax=Neobacillus endophyticus TaxID=2738405 RepID=UPI001563B887|nr:hydrolase [Neobacillus endophyticus]NRD76233.1 hydrolase [Neobacillus endophyticus]